VAALLLPQGDLSENYSTNSTVSTATVEEEICRLECRLAALALAAGVTGEAALHLTRATHFCRLRGTDDDELRKLIPAAAAFHASRPAS